MELENKVEPPSEQQQSKDVNIDALKYLRDKIETLTVFQQTEILRILQMNKVTFSENKNGIFVNLTYVSEDVIKKINEYIMYVDKQELQLNEVEEKKIVLSNQYFK
jgi:hypothetical protein